MDLIWLVVFIVVVLWLAGFALSIAGGAIHLLLLVALALIIYRLWTGRKV